MATPLPIIDHPRLRLPDGTARRPMPHEGASTATVRPADPPAGGVHARLIGLAASMVVVFLLATAFFMTGNPGTDLNLFGVAGFAVIFFTLTLGLSARAARDPRWSGTPDRRDDTLGSLVKRKVTIATGTLNGRDAMVQVLLLPVTLAAGMVVIGLIFAMGL